MKKVTSIVVVLLLLLCSFSFLLLTAQATEFDDWTFGGGTFTNDAIDGRIEWTNLQTRNGNHYAYDTLSASANVDDFNITWDWYVDLDANTGTQVHFEICATAHSTTTADHCDDSVRMKCGYYFSGSGYDYLIANVYDSGSEIFKYEIQGLTTTHLYHCNVERYQNPGNSTWRVDFTVWTDAGSYASPNVMDKTAWYADTPVSFQYANLRNYNTGQNGYISSGYLDNYVYDGESEEDTPLAEITEIPMLNAFSGIEYTYDANTTGGESYSLATNATNLTINAITGLVTGDFTDYDIGVYYANITASNSTTSVYKNYTLRVSDTPHAAITDGNDCAVTATWGARQYGTKIYVPYMRDGSAQGDMAVACYDTDTKLWSYSPDIGVNPTDDYHGGACIVRDKLGYLHVFWGAHEGTIRYARSESPDNISSWDIMTSPASAATYPMPWCDPVTGKIFLFYRVTEASGSNYRWDYKVSEDGGSTWSSATTWVDTPAGYVFYAAFSEPYLRGDDYVMSISGPNHIYATGQHEDMYYMEFNFVDEQLYSVTGVSLPMPFDTTTAAAPVKTYESSGDGVWGGPPTVIDGVPYLLFKAEDGATYDLCVQIWDTDHWDDPMVLEEDDSTYWTFGSIEDAGGGELVLYVVDAPTTRDHVMKYYYDGSTWEKVGYVLHQSQQSDNADIFGTCFPVWGDNCSMVIIGEEASSGLPITVYIYSDAFGFLVNGTTVPDGWEYPDISPPGPNWAPTFTSTPTIHLVNGGAYYYLVTCNESVVFALVETPDFLAFTSATGVLQGFIIKENAGEYTINISATSVLGEGTAYHEFNLTVELWGDAASWMAMDQPDALGLVIFGAAAVFMIVIAVIFRGRKE